MSVNLTSSLEWRCWLQEEHEILEHYLIRELHIQCLGYSILTKESINSLASFINGRKVVDLGCGTGYLAAVLKHIHGVDVTAVDSSIHTIQTELLKKSSLNAFHYNAIVKSDMLDVNLKEFDGVILSWPDYESDSAFKIANKLTKGQFIIYQGDRELTANEAFYNCMNTFKRLSDVAEKVNSTHVSFYGINDCWDFFVKT